MHNNYNNLTCSFLQPGHDELISLMLGSSCHMISDSTCPIDHYDLDPVGKVDG